MVNNFIDDIDFVPRSNDKNRYNKQTEDKKNINKIK